MQILCVKTTKLPVEITTVTNSFTTKIDKIVNTSDIEWIERTEAETNFNYKQLIPYILLKRADGKYACYQRHGNEKRLHGKYSAGIGGHIDEPDNQSDVIKTIEVGMYRELSEELSNFKKDKVRLKFLGLINEIESEVGLVHLGIVYIAECSEGYIPEAASELKNMEWKSVDEIAEVEKELWTELAFRLV